MEQIAAPVSEHRPHHLIVAANFYGVDFTHLGEELSLIHI